MKSLMPIALDYSGTNLSRVPVAHRLQAEDRASSHREEQGGLAIGPEEMHHRLGRCRITMGLWEEQD